MTATQFPEQFLGATSYRFKRKIAAGGMGSVYEAEQYGAEGFVKTVAIKTILPKFSDNREFVDMFIGEVGIDPRAGDGGRGYRRRVAGLIAAGQAYARFENGQVVFKAEIGSQSPKVGQIQGVWVHPEWRGHGVGTAGTAAVAAAVLAAIRELIPASPHTLTCSAPSSICHPSIFLHAA